MGLPSKIFVLTDEKGNLGDVSLYPEGERTKEYVLKEELHNWLRTELEALSWYNEKMGHVTGSVGRNETSGKIEECERFIKKLNSL